MADAFITMNARQVGRVSRGIRQCSRPAWLALRQRLAVIGAEVAHEAEQRAGSERIQVHSRVTAAGNVRIYVEGDPGVPIENNGKGFVRHPVFIPRSQLPGPPGRWTSKNSRPAFLLPTYARRREWALTEMEKAYWDAFQRAWSRGG